MGTHSRSRIELHSKHRYPAKWFKWIYARLFKSSLVDGALGLQFADEIVEVESGPYVATIAPPSMWRMIWMLLKPDFRVPRYYTKGYWSCEQEKLYDVLELFTRSRQTPLHSWFRFFNKNPVRDRLTYRLFPMKVSQNIAMHYNTSPAFMRLILGETLEYTCAFFEAPDDTLKSAQERKINRVIDRLGIKKRHRVLDLGCGWGQIAERVSKETGAHVTGVNLTPNQIEYAKQNRSSNTQFELTDYRAFHSPVPFNRIYSIGMLEHIGRGLIPEYLGKIEELLDDGGVALIHSIVRSEAGSTNSWIDQEVFPGAYIPQLSEVVDCIDQSSLRFETIYSHDKSNYYQTLSAWLDNYYRQNLDLRVILEQSVSVQDSETIMRIWEFYLAGSQLVFNDSNGYCYNVQIVVSKQ